MNEYDRPARPSPPSPSNASLVVLFLLLTAAGCLILLGSGCRPSPQPETSASHPASPLATTATHRVDAGSLSQLQPPTPPGGSFEQAAATLERALDTGDLSSVTLPIRSFQAFRPGTADQVRQANDLLRRYNDLVERTVRPHP